MNPDTISQSTSFRVNAPRVVHQTLDGETIIIDFGNGSYFSTNATGAIIWQQIVRNAPVNHIIQLLTGSYIGDETTIRNGVEQFISELEREWLIVPMDGASLSPDAAPVMPNPIPTSQPTFQTPSLDKYTDMQDLLLLDAIHDVDEQGWPVKKGENAE